jgi:hypothetical protein
MNRLRQEIWNRGSASQTTVHAVLPALLHHWRVSGEWAARAS